jgi:mono/diheme cytochrome c family protein/DNA-binding beta-propeller fold protein YncE
MNPSMPAGARRTCAALVLVGLWPSGAAFAGPVDAAGLYARHCATCHGADRYGAMGPALLPENLGRLKRAEAATVIRDGRVATQMPGFGEPLTADQIAQLVDYIYVPPPVEPVWGEAEIRASQLRVLQPGDKLSDRPVFKVKDPLNLFVVVELGDHHFTLVDGDRFRPVGRFPTRFALHGGPKFSPDGRFVYFASRDGWISKFDIWNLKYLAEIRAGINTRNLAVAADGRTVMVANTLPRTLVALDAGDLTLRKVIAVRDDAGRSSRVSAVYDAGPRKSFIAALRDIPELWEIPWNNDHEPIYPGLVHDYRMGEALAAPGPFPVRRIRLDDSLDDFFFAPRYEDLIGAAGTGQRAQVVNLLVGRKIADIPLPGLPHLGSGISWPYQGTTVLATPNLRDGAISVIDMKSWKIIKRIETPGPGFFLRSHEGTPYAWADNMLSARKDTLTIIDKRTLEVARSLTPAPGKTAAHVEFTRDGRYALVSLWEQDGAVVVYDARTFKEVTRLPMSKPSGKYNVYNKIHHSEGTSR